MAGGGGAQLLPLLLLLLLQLLLLLLHRGEPRPAGTRDKLSAFFAPTTICRTMRWLLQRLLRMLLQRLLRACRWGYPSGMASPLQSAGPHTLQEAAPHHRGTRSKG